MARRRYEAQTYQARQGRRGLCPAPPPLSFPLHIPYRTNECAAASCFTHDHGNCVPVRPHVFREVAGPREGLAACVAAVGLRLPRMRPHVHDEVVCSLLGVLRALFAVCLVSSVLYKLAWVSCRRHQTRLALPMVRAAAAAAAATDTATLPAAARRSRAAEDGGGGGGGGGGVASVSTCARAGGRSIVFMSALYIFFKRLRTMASLRRASRGRECLHAGELCCCYLSNHHRADAKRHLKPV
jgi:hypothetical protein